MLKTYIRIWFVVTAALTMEFYLLNFMPQMSISAHLRGKLPGLPINFNISPEAGKPISWGLGIAGFALMLLMNGYSMRKRLGFMKKMGRLSSWLDFHIFCGLVGPTLILFHTNFKIGGLVAVAFWSMVISFASGVVGRYFYSQLIAQKAELESDLRAFENDLDQYQARAGLALAPGAIGVLKERVLAMAGAPLAEEAPSLLACMVGSFSGDLRLHFGFAKLAASLPDSVRRHLKAFALEKRRLGYYAQFQRMMGYWHSFHFPFAILMYAMAAVHIAAELLFRVSS